MKIDRCIKVIVVWFALLMSQVASSYVGIRVAVNEETILTVQKHYFPKVLEKIKDVKIPDLDFSYGARLATTIIKISKVEINLNKIKSENIAITFQGHSGIKLKVSHITTSGTLFATAKTGFLPTLESDVLIDVKNLNIEILAEIGWQPHPSQKGKHAMTLQVSDVKVDLDVDFQLSNTLLDVAKNYFEETIRASINGFLKSSLKEKLLPILNEKCKHFSETMPVHVNLHNNMIIDYSLIEKPIIKHNILILNVEGKIVQKGDPYDKADFPVGSIPLPQITEIHKGVKALISTYTVNTLLHTLFYSGKLKFTFPIPDIVSMIPKKESLLKNLHPINRIRSSLKTKFGKNRKGLLEFEFQETPQISFANKKISSFLKLKIAFSAEEDGKYELYSGYLVEVQLEANVLALERGSLNAGIEQIEIVSFKTLSDKVGGDFSEESITRGFLNYGISQARDDLNRDYLSNIHFTLPSVHDVDLLDSSVVVHDDHLEFEWRANFNNRRKLKRKRYFK